MVKENPEDSKEDSLSESSEGMEDDNSDSDISQGEGMKTSTPTRGKKHKKPGLDSSGSLSPVSSSEGGDQHESRDKKLRIDAGDKVSSAGGLLGRENQWNLGLKQQELDDKHEQSEDQLDQSEEQLEQSEEQLEQSGEQFEQSLKQLGQSGEQLVQSGEQLEQSREQLEQSGEKLEPSAEQQTVDSQPGVQSSVEDSMGQVTVGEGLPAAPPEASSPGGRGGGV